jgi:hypothetical protein
MELIADLNHPLFKNVSSNDFPVFFSVEYALFLKSQNTKMALVYDEIQRIVMPIKLWSSKVLNYITCLFPPLKNGNLLEAQDEKLFLETFLNFVGQNKLADRISSPENFAIFQSYPNASISARFGSYRVALYPNTFETVFLKYQARYRSAINNAKKQAIQIKYGKSVLTDFYQLHQLTMQRSSMHVHPLSYFEAYLKYLPNQVHLAVAFANGEAIGAVLNVYNTYSAYYLYGCSSNNTYASGAIKYLHSDAMEKFISKQVRCYDFVGARLSDVSGTKLQGIQDFKSRFGSDLYKGVLWKYDVNKWKCKTLDKLLNFKINIKGGSLPLDIIDQELSK